MATEVLVITDTYIRKGSLIEDSERDPDTYYAQLTFTTMDGNGTYPLFLALLSEQEDKEIADIALDFRDIQ